MDLREKIIKGHDQIKSHIHRTDVLHSSLIDEIAGAEIYFKCENFQKMGAFKIRGATHAILNLSEVQRAKGVVTHSSGNMAQAVALAARMLNIPAYIVMPSNAPKVKVNAVKDYGGIITICEPTIEDRQRQADIIIEKTGASFVHPFNDINVVIGQATAAKEFLEDYPDLEIILAPVGGGGLASGTALSAKYFGNGCICVGAEPEIVDDAFRSLQSGKIEKNKSIDTIADGLRTNLGPVTFDILSEHIDKIITVSEEEIIQAMRLIFERMKIIIEPSAAVPFAAVLKEKEYFKDKKIGIILSGGNVDVSDLPF